MTLMARMTRLLRADLHAVLDRIEEPAALVRQAVREMEALLAEDQRRLERLRESHRELLTRDSELARAIAASDQELDLCFAAAQENLARALVRRKLENERLRRLGTRRQASLEKMLATLEGRVREEGLRLEEMRQQVVLAAGDDTYPSPETDPLPAGQAIRAEDVEIAFLREQQRRCRP